MKIKGFMLSACLGAVALSVGCGAGSAIKELEDIKKEACECKDAECAKKIGEKLEAWAKKHEKTQGTDKDKEKVEKLGTEVAECILKASLGGAGGGDKE